MVKKYTLGSKQRLKGRKAIETLFKSGNRFNAGPFRVIYKLDDGSGLLSGVGVSSKLFKKATDRNRIKRLIREACRLQKIPLEDKLQEKQKQLHLFITYGGNRIPNFDDTKKFIKTILERLEDIT